MTYLPPVLHKHRIAFNLPSSGDAGTPFSSKGLHKVAVGSGTPGSASTFMPLDDFKTQALLSHLSDEQREALRG